jgi:hypothetical protein
MTTTSSFANLLLALRDPDRSDEVGGENVADDVDVRYGQCILRDRTHEDVNQDGPEQLLGRKHRVFEQRKQSVRGALDGDVGRNTSTS